MKSPLKNLTLREQWEMAARLIEDYGAEVGDYIMEQTRACIDSDDSEATKLWCDMIDKVKMLWGPCDGDTIN